MNCSERIEKFDIMISSSREWYKGFNFAKEFSENIFEADEFSLRFQIDIYDIELDKKVAYIKGTIFDEDKLLDIGIDIVEGADFISQENYDSCYWLSKSEVYKNKAEDWIFCNAFSGYLATFYIYDSYRNKGIAKYLLNNLNVFLKYSLNIDLRCLCTYPQPQSPEKWDNIKDEKMKKVMIDTILKCGFKAVENENYFVREYKLL